MQKDSRLLSREGTVQPFVKTRKDVYVEMLEEERTFLHSKLRALHGQLFLTVLIEIRVCIPLLSMMLTVDMRPSSLMVALASSPPPAAIASS